MEGGAFLVNTTELLRRIPPNQPTVTEILWRLALSLAIYLVILLTAFLVQELCESRGGRPGLSVLMSLLASVDVKLY